MVLNLVLELYSFSLSLSFYGFQSFSSLFLLFIFFFFLDLYLPGSLLLFDHFHPLLLLSLSFLFLFLPFIFFDFICLLRNDYFKFFLQLQKVFLFVLNLLLDVFFLYLLVPLIVSDLLDFLLFGVDLLVDFVDLIPDEVGHVYELLLLLVKLLGQGIGTALSKSLTNFQWHGSQQSRESLEMKGITRFRLQHFLQKI